MEPLPSKPIDMGTAWRRAMREFGPTYLGLRGVAWSISWGAVGIGATIYLSAHHSLRAQVAIGVGLFLAGIGWAAFSILGALWVTAPVLQRNEARDELKRREDRYESLIPEFAFEDDGSFLVELRNWGEPIKAAIINLLAPESVGSVVYAPFNGEPPSGWQRFDYVDENKLLDGRRSLVWVEKNLHLAGNNSTTVLRFRFGTLPFGPFPIIFKIGGDELPGWVRFDADLSSLLTQRPGESGGPSGH